LSSKQKYGKLPEDVFPEKLQRLKQKGLINITDKEITVTKLGDIWKETSFGNLRQKLTT